MSVYSSSLEPAQNSGGSWPVIRGDHTKKVTVVTAHRLCAADTIQTDILNILNKLAQNGENFREISLLAWKPVNSVNLTHRRSKEPFSIEAI